MNFRRFWYAAPLALGLPLAAAQLWPPPVQRAVAQSLSPPRRLEPARSSAPTPTPVSRSVVASPTPVPRPRFIKVGLSTAGAPIEFYALGALGLSDPLQAGRKLQIPSGSRVQFIYGPRESVKEGSRTWSGSISVQTSGGVSQGWQAVKIYAASGPTSVSTNGQNPRWGRPYRGHFEVWPQRAPEPLKRKGFLTLINVVPLEEYLKGVVPWEMNPDAPLEALKAQAICARTQTLAKMDYGRHSADGFDICDYDHCQGYPGAENEKARSTAAVEQTRGWAIFYQGRVIDAVYGTNSGGITADAADVWRATMPAPYLKSVRDYGAGSPLKLIVKRNMSEADWAQYCAAPWPSYAAPGEGQKRELVSRRARFPRTAALFGPDDLPEFYRWRRFISAVEANKAFAAQGFDQVTNIEVVERTSSGRIKKLRVRGLNPRVPVVSSTYATPAPLFAKDLLLEGDAAIRSLFSKRLGSTTALPSSTFSITPQADAAGKVSGWSFQGAGWGHGVGMCQRGAQNHAREGWDARRIIKWYFHGVQILEVK